MSDERLILGARIENEGWGREHLMVSLDDGTEQKLFGWYIDELGFSANEFVGKTVSGAYRVHLERDVAYLRS